MSKLGYTVDFLNVGFGLCMTAYPTQDRFPVLVVDGGYDRPQQYIGCALSLEEHLSRLGVKEVDLMVSTHPHRDHIGGLARVVEQFPVRRFLTGLACVPHIPFDKGSTGNMAAALELLRGMLERLHGQNAHVISVTGTTRIRCGRAELTITTPANTAIVRRDKALTQCGKAPNPAAFRELSNTLNETSLLVSLNVNGAGFLLPGDRNLVDLPRWEQSIPSCQVLQIPHHGDKNHLSREAVEAICAKTGVVSADTHGTYGLPSAGLEETLASWGMENILYTTGSLEKETASGIRFLISGDGALEQQWIPCK